MTFDTGWHVNPLVGAERMCLHGKWSMANGCFFQYYLFNYNKRKAHFKIYFEIAPEAEKK
ncbi:MAG: hypothetical protein LBK66_01685 [Spirochaetaceae bacterium]|nr:hypothetical protein [Spirochaetaceae bacterium]